MIETWILYKDGKPNTTCKDRYPKVWTRRHFNLRRYELAYKIEKLIHVNLYNVNCLRSFVNTFEKEFSVDKKGNLILDTEENRQYVSCCIHTHELLACRDQEGANYLLGYH